MTEPLTTKAAEIRARLRAAIELGDRTGSRGKRPENIYNVADDALVLIEQQAAELAEARERGDRYERIAHEHRSFIGELKPSLRKAESERDELLREKERLGAALQKLHDAASVFHNAALVHLSDTTFDSDGGLSEADAELSVNALPGARSALENGPAGLADARSEPTDPSSQSRIAVLEAALRPFAKAAEHDIGSTETDADIFQQMGQYNRAPKITVGDMRRARAALAPLGEE